MHRWICDNPTCGNDAMGTGGAIGLRAIGWDVELREKDPRGRWLHTILCPAHRRDAMSCTKRCPDQVTGERFLCHICAGRAEAEEWQATITGACRPIPVDE